MSGQPNINPLDPVKFRSAYMANLSLRADLDDVNLQANKIYKRTGQLPQEITDNRTSAERLADIMRLRVEARSRLREIADGQQANKISEEMTSRETIFYAQQYPLINSMIRMRYSQGVLAGIFLPFLRRFMSETAGNEGVGTGLQQTSGANILLNAGNILKGMITGQDLHNIIRETNDMSRSPTRMMLLRSIGYLQQHLPSSNLNLEVEAIQDAFTKNDVLHQLNAGLREFPTTFEASELLDRYRRFKSARDRGSQERVLGEMLQSIVITPIAAAQLGAVKATISRYMGRAEASPDENVFVSSVRGAEGAPLFGEDKSQDLAGDWATDMEEDAAGSRAGVVVEDAEAQFVGDESMAMAEEAVAGEPEQKQTDETAETPAFYTTKRGAIPLNKQLTKDEVTGLTRVALVAWLRGKINAAPRDSEVYKGIIYNGKKLTRKAPLTEAKFNENQIKVFLRTGDILAKYNAISVPETEQTQLGTAEMEEEFDYDAEATQTTGSGVARRRTRTRSRIRGAGLSVGVKPSERFIPFGRYVINQHRLNDDVIAVKRKAGSCLKDFPSCRVGSNLAKVMRKIVGGGIPKFEEFEALGDGERAYLHKLAKSANILDKLSIPAPNKTEGDKMVDEFEVMKGEIMAGNDNKEMIKKFKIMIMKLSQAQLLPKAQVRDLLFDLTSMGF
tara:strand:+ start:3913 stop:5937 length:2025 start_codon:yes stop_codon:yes gene_type:complete